MALCIAVLGLASMPGVYADEFIGLTYQSGRPIDFRGDCNTNGTYCSPSTSCNLTAFYPGGAVYVDNVPTTNQISFYNRTLPAVNVLGLYSARWMCYDPVAGYAGENAYTFMVTSTGTAGGGNMIIFLLLLGVAVIVFGFSIFLKNEYVGAIASFLLLCSGLYFTIYGIGIEANLYTNAIGFVLIGVGAVLLIFCSYRAITAGEGFSMGAKEKELDL